MHDGGVARVVSALTVAAASIGLLAACATAPTPVPPGPSRTELADYAKQQLVDYWNELDLPEDIARPTVTARAYLSVDARSAAIDYCITRIGRDGFRELDDTARVKVLAGGGDRRTGYAIASYVCEARYPQKLEDLGLLSTAQRQYLYDYYSSWVVPCFVGNGYSLSMSPSRAEFVRDKFSLWSPFSSVVEPVSSSEYSRLNSECGVYPRALFPAVVTGAQAGAVSNG